MLLVSALMFFSFVFSLIYLPVKIIADVRGNRAGWAAVGSVALLGILAQLVLGLVLLFGLSPRI